MPIETEVGATQNPLENFVYFHAVSWQNSFEELSKLNADSNPLNATLVKTRSNKDEVLPKIRTFAHVVEQSPIIAFDLACHTVGWAGDIHSNKYDFKGATSWPEMSAIEDMAAWQKRTAPTMSPRFLPYSSKLSTLSLHSKSEEIYKLLSNFSTRNLRVEEPDHQYYNYEGKTITKAELEMKLGKYMSPLYHRRKDYLPETFEDLSHNECLIKTVTSCAKSIVVIDEKDSLTILKALSLKKSLERKKQEILSDPKKLEKEIYFYESSLKFIEAKQEFLRNRLAIYEKDLANLTQKDYVFNENLQTAASRKERKFGPEIASLLGKSEVAVKNRETWLLRNIAKTQAEIENIEKEKPQFKKTQEEIIERLKREISIEVYKKEFSLLRVIDDETLADERQRAIYDLKRRAKDDAAILGDLIRLQVSLEDIKEIIFDNPDVNVQKQLSYNERSSDDNIFFLAASFGNKDLLWHIYENVEYKSNYGFSLRAILQESFYHAASKNNIEAVKSLFPIFESFLEGDVYSKRSIRNALARSIENNAPDVFEYFMTEKSDIFNDQQELSSREMSYENNARNELLRNALENSKLKMAKKMLETGYIKVFDEEKKEVRNLGFFKDILLQMVEKGKSDIAKLLISEIFKSGYSANTLYNPSASNRHILSIAVDKCDIETVEMLIKKDINAGQKDIKKAKSLLQEKVESLRLQRPSATSEQTLEKYQEVLANLQTAQERALQKENQPAPKAPSTSVSPHQARSVAAASPRQLPTTPTR